MREAGLSADNGSHRDFAGLVKDNHSFFIRSGRIAGKGKPNVRFQVHHIAGGVSGHF